MKNKIKLNEKIVNTCQLPKDVIWGASIITMTGNKELLIENFKNIIKFQSEVLIIQCKNYKIQIDGINLTIELYTKDEIKLLGIIHEIKFLTGDHH